MLKSCQPPLAFPTQNSVGPERDKPFVGNVASSASYRQQHNTRVTSYPR